jgi:hypothetical protein
MEKDSEDEDHPIDAAVKRRVPQEAAQKQLVRLQKEVEIQLRDRKPFIDLETLRNNLGMDREEAYFNVGYERGLAEGAARASPFTRSAKGKQLAREVRDLAVQAQLPPGEVVAVLFECLCAALSASREASSGTGVGKLVADTAA